MRWFLCFPTFSRCQVLKNTIYSGGWIVKNKRWAIWEYSKRVQCIVRICSLQLFSVGRNCTSWFVHKAVAFSFSAVSDCPLVFVCLSVCPYFCMTQYWIAGLLYELLFVFRLFGKFIEGISDKFYWSCCQIAVVWTSSSSEHEKGERNCQRYAIGKSYYTMV